MSERMMSVLAAPAVLLGLAACTAHEAAPDTFSDPGPVKARVVVAVVDSSINPYHDFFNANGPIYPGIAPSSVTPEVLAELGVDPHDRVRLTRSGDIDADIAADAGFWSRVEHGRPYWFEGTNIVAVSFCEASFDPLKPQADKNPHGTGVSSAVFKANPEAVVLFVESCAQPDPHELKYVLEHPAVDMLSHSYNLGLPLTEAGAYRGVLEFGKLIFQAAGNFLVPVSYQGGPGSWWTIGISGIDDQSNGQTTSGALLPDFVSGYVDTLPFCNDCESELVTVGGTSISTPHAAGLASRALLEVRRRVGHGGGIVPSTGDKAAALVVDGDRRITNWDFRRALEEAAFVDYGPDDYTGPTVVVDLPPVESVPINPFAPWLQLAWGELSAHPRKGVLGETLAHLGFGAPTRQKASGYCDYMAAQMRRRQAYSDLRGQATGEVVPDPNPYRFCDGE